MKNFEVRVLDGNLYLIMDKSTGEIYQTYQVSDAIKYLKKRNGLISKNITKEELDQFISETDKKRNTLLTDLKFFCLKTFLVSFIFIALTIFALPNITAAVSRSIQILTKSVVIDDKFADPRFWLIRVPEKLNSKFTELSDAERKQFSQELSKLIQNLRAIFNEIQ